MNMYAERNDGKWVTRFMGFRIEARTWPQLKRRCRRLVQIAQAEQEAALAFSDNRYHGGIHE